MWEYRGDVDNGSIQHLDLVFIDEQGDAIYGEVPADHVEAKRTQLHEGHVYALNQFLVCANKDKYRSTDSKYTIELTYYTEIKEVADVPLEFPMYAYNLVPIGQLPAYVGETAKFLDVTGVIVGVSNAVAVQGANQSAPSIKRVIISRDASDYEVKPALWGQRASEFDVDRVYESG